MRKVALPSGAELTINPAPFADSKNLYQALLKELKEVKIDTQMEVVELYKNLFCVGFSSQEIETYLWKCLERCQYDNGKNGPLKIVQDTFEPVEAREDYTTVLAEVVKENVLPFGKTLFAEYGKFSTILGNIPK